MADNPPLLRALEAGRIDLVRAMHLAGVRDEALLQQLIGLVPRYTPEAFYGLVQQRVAGSNTDPDRDERRLALMAGRLARVEVVIPGAREHPQRIVETAERSHPKTTARHKRHSSRSMSTMVHDVNDFVGQAEIGRESCFRPKAAKAVATTVRRSRRTHGPAPRHAA
jgi:hypothetical protein